jgi:hypothetical protein
MSMATRTDTQSPALGVGLAGRGLVQANRSSSAAAISNLVFRSTTSPRYERMTKANGSGPVAALLERVEDEVEAVFERGREAVGHEERREEHQPLDVVEV